MFKFTLLIALTVCVTIIRAELPSPLAARLKSGPYPAAGFRPQRPFNLPGEYLPPAANQEQKQPQPQAFNIEISKERVDFVGQVQDENNLGNQKPQNAYLPPQNVEGDAPNNVNNNNSNDDDSLQLQGLPTLSPAQFSNEQFLNKQLLSKQPIRGEAAPFGQRLQPRPQPQIRPIKQFQSQQQPQPLAQPQSQQIRPIKQFQSQHPPQPLAQPQSQQFRPNKQFQSQQQPQQQNFRPVIQFQTQSQPQQQNFRPITQFQPQPQTQPQFFPDRRPAQQYGAPALGQINIIYPEPRNAATADEAAEDTADSRAALEALNEAVAAYNRAQSQRAIAETDAADVEEVEDDVNAPLDDVNAPLEDVNATDDDANTLNGYPARAAPSARFTQGQYYVLGPDNALQRVQFTTSQDETEARTNGFTAQLKYMPVGEIRDPVFKHNERGQLVRILKK